MYFGTFRWKDYILYLRNIDGSFRIMKIYHPVAIIIITARAFAWTRTMKLFSDMTKQYLTYTHQKWIFSKHKIRALFFYALIYLRNMCPFFFTLFRLKLVDESLTRIMSNRQFSLIERLCYSNKLKKNRLYFYVNYTCFFFIFLTISF